MSEPFKNMFNKKFLERFSKDLIVVIPHFDTREFTNQVMDYQWENREFKERCRHIATVLKKFLPSEYKDAIAKILELLDYIEKKQPNFSKIDDTKFGLR